MKLLVLALALASASAFAQVNYSNSAVVAKEHSSFKIDQAVYTLIPTKTEERNIPGCNPYGEASEDCTETVVLESEPVVQVFVDYTEGIFRDPEMPGAYLAFNFPVSDFTADQIAALKIASPMWRLRGGSVRKSFAKNNFALDLQLVNRTIQLVDVRRSTLCPIMESGESLPGCVERLVYKDEVIKARQVTVNKK